MITATAGDGNEVYPGTVVIDEATGDTGKITDIYDNGQARVILPSFHGYAPVLVPLAELNVAGDQTWDWRN